MTPTILSVDDSSDDLMLLQFACEAVNVSFRLECVQSGEEAIAYLEGVHGYGDRASFPLPDLILLDLKMPGISGFEVLSWIRRHPTLRVLPVVVLTASVHPEDRARALALGASQFIVKPVNYDALQLLVQTIDRSLVATGPFKFEAFKIPDAPQADFNGH